MLTRRHRHEGPLDDGRRVIQGALPPALEKPAGAVTVRPAAEEQEGGREGVPASPAHEAPEHVPVEDQESVRILCCGSLFRFVLCFSFLSCVC